MTLRHLTDIGHEQSVEKTIQGIFDTVLQKNVVFDVLTASQKNEFFNRSLDLQS